MTVETPASLLTGLKAARRLPSPPGTALRVLELCRRDEIDVREIADAIMSDPALSARLLKYANSSMIGARQAVTSVRDAVLRLGLRSVKITALGFSLAAPDSPIACAGFDLPSFWKESFVTAVTARRLAREFFNADREEAFTAGLLARIGRLALAAALPDVYGGVIAQASQEGIPLAEAERQSLGTDHAAFGAELLNEWGLPAALAQAVREQAVTAEPDAGGSVLAQVVRTAVALSPLLIPGRSGTGDERGHAQTTVKQRLKLDEPAWERLAGEIRSDYERVAKLFDLARTARVNMFDLYAEAQEEASRVGMVTQLERLRVLEENKALLQKATTDPLTGVANRARLEERLEELRRGLLRKHGDFAVVICDIDHFKRFNDTHGHAVGDLVLRSVARELHRTLRDVDLLGRYGGEEFVILAPCTDRRGGCVVAARACRSIERLRVAHEGAELHVTISAGLALTCDYEQPPETAQVLADADKQLYLSKQAGRNTWSYLGRSASMVAEVSPGAASQTVAPTCAAASG